MIAPTPTNNFTAYRQCCAEQALLPPEQWAFKRDPRYRRILEHVTKEQGEEFLEVVQEAAGDWWPVIRERFPQWAAQNDRYGKPLMESFPTVNAVCSPSNLRYLAHAILIWRHVERLGLREVRFVELGGGYGGLAFYMDALSEMNWVRAGWSYVIVDVPEVGALQAVYNNALGLPVETVNGLNADELDALRWYWDDGPLYPHYCISAFAFSEFDRDTQDWYRERLVRHCAHGFMVWNFMEPLVGVAEKPLGGPLYPFVDAPLTITPERPSTGPGNVVVTW